MRSGMIGFTAALSMMTANSAFGLDINEIRIGEYYYYDLYRGNVEVEVLGVYPGQNRDIVAIHITEGEYEGEVRRVNSDLIFTSEQSRRNDLLEQMCDAFEHGNFNEIEGGTLHISGGGGRGTRRHVTGDGSAICNSNPRDFGGVDTGSTEPPTVYVSEPDYSR